MKGTCTSCRAADVELDPQTQVCPRCAPARARQDRIDQQIREKFDPRHTRPLFTPARKKKERAR